MSDFVELCESMGFSAGDPEAIDKMIEMYSEEDLSDDCLSVEDDTFKEDLSFFEDQVGFEFLKEDK